MLKFLQRAARPGEGALPHRSLAVLATLLALPMSAFAGEGEGIHIQFDKSQNVGLWISLAVGLISVLYGLVYLRGSVLSQSPGSEKMQEVGQAIREGALAYLRKQISTMSIFIVILFLGLVYLNWYLGAALGFGIGACFVAGVVASYVSGYVGMLTAVSGNMRTAHAALSGPRTPLVIAFRSGAVAGTVTVGIGLIGASTILLAFPNHATQLLVGFGFGASLAALFMRVGGGIFTKAADVGADLVGKVEAGIPEDDPRNPAVIADNVGDNVGDCAGMAADVFESYEVTLVAAIILGAATSVVFDAQTWPKLIVFGLDACAIGLLSSALASQFVSGSNDPKADQLSFLNKGFWTTAGLSFVLTGLLAFCTLGGIGKPLQTDQLLSSTDSQLDQITALKAVQHRLALKDKTEDWQVPVKEVLSDPETAKLGFDPTKDEQNVSRLLQTPVDQLPKAGSLKGLTKVISFDDPSNPVLGYAVRNTAAPTTPGGQTFESVGAYFGDKDPLIAAKIHFVYHSAAVPAKGKLPARAEQNVEQTQWLGPLKQSDLNKLLDRAKQSFKAPGITGSLDIKDQRPAFLFTSQDGRAALAVEGPVDKPEQLNAQQVAGGGYFKATASQVNQLMSAPQTQAPAVPPEGRFDVAVINHHVVPWYAFWLTLSFGILMAFAIQLLTDYYVSTEKGPTKEVAGVATAGAAPMVIQGFAHACTSSVFTVISIVIALIVPLIAFSPTVYGGYTLSFYGVALVGVGMLTTTAFILAMDTFGPISDNAQGVFEMSGAADDNPEAAHVLTKLDAVGNTTKALTKGYAIATAVVAAVALFHSYLEGAHLVTTGLRLDMPEIFLGLLIGGAAPYLFAAFSINAVGRAAFELINEVRRQFRTDGGIMAGTSKPDYAKCVAIVTSAAQKELLAPGILAIALPIAVGFGFSIGKEPTDLGGGQIFNLTGAQALGGFLAGAIISGQLMAVLLSNSGGIWDNAKKLIEDGLHGGKGTDAYRSAVVCDTIGDPFKDTAGPAMNPLIKVMNLVALLISAVVIRPFSPWVAPLVTALCLLALVVAFVTSNKGSMSDSFTKALAEEPAPLNATRATAELPSVDVESTPAPAKKKLFVEDDSQP